MIPMPDILYDLISGYVKCLENLYLFTTEAGAICSKTSFVYTWPSIMRKLNKTAGGKDDIKPIIGLTPHILRHDYATSLYYAGVDIKEAQYLLGHSDIPHDTPHLYTSETRQ